jgi:ribosomal protein S15P/S13E
MKKWWISLIGVLAFSLSAWALTQTGMPALDDLYGDLAGYGSLSRRLGFSEGQRKDLMKYIERKAEDLRPIRDEAAAGKGGDKRAAENALYAAREDAFRGLRERMTAGQYDELKAWREDGKDGTDKGRPEAVTQIYLPALNDLHQDLAANGPVSRRLDFTDGQRRDLLNYIEKQAGAMQQVKGDKEAAGRKADRKEKKGADLKESRVEQKAAVNNLVAMRENALRGLKGLMTDRQYAGLEQWLGERADK